MASRYLILLDDDDDTVRLYRRVLQPLADRDKVLIREFTDDRDAAQFVAANASAIVGVMQDLVRRTDGIDMAGFNFLDGIVRLLIPHARVAVISGNIYPKERRERLARYPAVRAFDKPINFGDITQAYAWILAHPAETTPRDHDIEYRRALVTEVGLPWLEIRKALARDPTLLHRMPSRRFEELIAELYKDYGWEVELTASVKDGGFDIIALRRDTPTEVKVLIEAKRYSPDRAVGVGVIRSLYATRYIYRASQVVLATSSHVSSDARKEFISSIPHELAFVERDAILDWCRHAQGHVLGGFESRL